ncbi:MAG: helix-turn-helix transcriptional regulator [Patescibacteria group bacterium]|nr:helix-turn-helix transcriptional regulator [Patescibacteria group bacterium]
MQKTDQKQCGKLLKVIGDFWTLSIIMELRDGELRFCQLQRALGNLNPVTLTNRLKKLEKAKFIYRRENPNEKLAVSYTLSKRGQGMLPVLTEVQKFAAKYRS